MHWWPMCQLAAYLDFEYEQSVADASPAATCRSSVFSMKDDRASVITLARSASHQVSRVWDRPEDARLSLDEALERGARSEADAALEQQHPTHDIEQPLLLQAHDINHDTASEVSAEDTSLQR